MDDESKKHLLEVKKGKPRKFVMIKDGVEIDRLYIFKKGPFDRYVRMAKQQGIRGEAYWGIVRGDGFDIRFELAQADGFTTPPGTQIRLKDFLKETTGSKFEPEYLIVDSSAPIEEFEPNEVANDEAQPEESVVAEDPGEKFVRLLKSILPHVKRSLATNTSVSDELQTRVREAQDLGRQRDFEHGMAALRHVGQLTKQAIAEAEASPAAVGIDQTVSPMDAAKTARCRQWEERLMQLEPHYRDAVNGENSGAGKLRIVMNYARSQAERRQFVKALVGLDRLAQLLGESK
jgi:hypothetical protein